MFIIASNLDHPLKFTNIFINSVNLIYVVLKKVENGIGFEVVLTNMINNIHTYT